MKKTFIIAEAGVNHNGNIKLALQLIDAAKNAGADAVKFQTFHTEDCISVNAEKADYQKTVIHESQYDMIKKLELSPENHTILVDYCAKKKIQFMSTAFDLLSVDLLMNYNLPVFKIASGEITNAPLLLKTARTQKSIILSTGMSTLADIEVALSILAFGYLNMENTRPSLNDFVETYYSDNGQQILKEKVSLLHCTTEYPAPFSEVNLNVLDTMRYAFGLPVGYSDHTQGIEISIAAVAKGAAIIEKHFTLDRNLPGPDHYASLEPNELKTMVMAIRHVEQSLGNGQKIPSKSELKNRHIVRKSLVATLPIQNGEIFTEKNMGIKRPGIGLSALQYWDLLGKQSHRSYVTDELISK